MDQTRLIREARIAAMLQHPNTVPTYELGRDNRGHCYFTMKLVHGYTFREVLDYRERYDLRRLMDVVIQIAHALEYAHSQRRRASRHQAGEHPGRPLRRGAAARLGPRQGMEPGGPAKRRGGGIEVDALNLEDLTITAQDKLQGTAAYMSPEQIREDPDIDWRTDVYSLGAVIYEILAGQPPVTGDTLEELLAQTLDKEPRPAVPGRTLGRVVKAGGTVLAVPCERGKRAHRHDRRPDPRVAGGLGIGDRGLRP